jgi:hypothetical protein
MKRNVGTIDQVVRLLLVLLIVVGFLNHLIAGWVAIGLGILAAILLVTSVAGFCPLYFLLKLSTKGK